MLVVVGGLPGTGKTTLSRSLAAERAATWLRIDTIEQTLRASGTLSGAVGPASYLVGYALAEANLRLGNTVVAECVNPLAITREAWRQAAHRAGAACIQIEVICSDPAEHRRRVETRTSDIPGLRLPTWADVLAREYEPWSTHRIVLDTAGRGAADCLDERRAAISAPSATPRPGE